jgi:type II secretory pathway pseudopilin PulG
VALVEVIFSTAIIATVGVGVLGSINYGMHVMKVTRENQRATQVMLERIESIRLYTWDQVTNAGFIPTSFTEAYDPSGPMGNQGTMYYGTMQVGAANLNGTPSYASSLRQFTVNLNWTNGGGIPHHRSLTTLVARDGMQNYVY